MKARKPERVRWTVTPDGRFTWRVRCRGVWLHTEPFKFLAVLWAAGQCRHDWKQQGIRSELVIMGKDGEIKDTRTYGDDPADTRG